MTAARPLRALQPRERELLVLAITEATEVARAAAKILQLGLDVRIPASGPHTNRERLSRELGQLAAVEAELRQCGIVSGQDRDDMTARRLATRGQWQTGELRG
jgi:hypothetical protein